VFLCQTSIVDDWRSKVAGMEKVDRPAFRTDVYVHDAATVDELALVRARKTCAGKACRSISLVGEACSVQRSAFHDFVSRFFTRFLCLCIWMIFFSVQSRGVRTRMFPHFRVDKHFKYLSEIMFRIVMTFHKRMTDAAISISQQRRLLSFSKGSFRRLYFLSTDCYNMWPRD